MRMTSSSKSVIKEWNPQVVREFITPVTVSQPVIRELDQQELTNPCRRKGTATEWSALSEVMQEAATDAEAADEEAAAAAEAASLELEEARRQAGELLEEARVQAEKIREEARQEGFAGGWDEGRKEGMKQAIKDMEEALARQKAAADRELSEALASIEQAKSRCLQKYLEQLKDCSFAVAEKVIHTSLEASGDIIKRMIVFETEKLKKTAWLKIYMEKSDYDMMMNTDADLVAELSKVSDNIKFIVMEKEQRGSCIIETPEEILDIGVETQMENIRDITSTIRV